MNLSSNIFEDRTAVNISFIGEVKPVSMSAILTHWREFENEMRWDELLPKSILIINLQCTLDHMRRSSFTYTKIHVYWIWYWYAAVTSVYESLGRIHWYCSEPSDSFLNRCITANKVGIQAAYPFEQWCCEGVGA